MAGKRKLRPLRVPYAMAVHGKEEEKAIVSLLRQRKTILGNKTKLFEKRVARLFGKEHGIAVNSGSSANLISLELFNFSRGAEIITPVLTFSTTVAPVLQKGLKPVFVDVKEGSFLIDVDRIADHITKRTVALLVPNLLGNVPDLERLRRIANEHGLRYIEDSCDTIGARFKGVPTGHFSDISTTSFYGSHVITAAGGGGMLCLDSEKWDSRARILRGWGRSSAVNESQSLQERFSATVDGIDYDSKFLFEEIGYNLLPLEIQSAFGLEQLKKLATFSRTRNAHFKTLYKFFSEYRDIFTLPVQSEQVKTTWLAFPLTIHKECRFSRKEIVLFLERNGIQTRPVFTGNVKRQPAFSHVGNGLDADRFPVADDIMHHSFVVGINQGLTDKHMSHMMRTFEEFLSKF